MEKIAVLGTGFSGFKERFCFYAKRKGKWIVKATLLH
jgi:hypothetical protein